MIFLLFIALMSFRYGSSDPFFLIFPTLTSIKIRATALLTPPTATQQYETFTIQSRLFLILRMMIYLINTPFWLTLWTLDDLFFPEYKQVKVEKAVFLVGGFRTGSTSLHRALSLDEERYVSARFLELVFPFLTLHKFFDFLEWVDKRFETKIISTVEARLQNAMGAEIMARHPMSWYEAEEDDVLLAAWHLTGWYTGTMFPNANAWIACGQQSTYPEEEQKQQFLFYKRTIQKILYRRGKGRAYLSKSHLIEFMPTLKKELPDSHFVGTVRNPKDTFVSWYALSQSASLVMGRWKLPDSSATKAHFVFWDKFAKKEIDFFKVPEGSEGNVGKTLIPFKSYISDQTGTVTKIYKDMDIPMSEALLGKLKEDEERHKDYKAKADYVNPTLSELGTSADEVEEKMGDYIKFFKL